MRTGPAKNCVVGILATAFLVAMSSPGWTEVEPPADTRDRLTFDQMMSEEWNLDGPIHNDYFMPVGQSEPAHHDFAGIIEIPTAMPFRMPGLFPDFSIAFFAMDGYLVPVDRDIVTSATSAWDIILSPGRIWSEPGDDGWSRASFPFVLAGTRYGESHNGLATFVYNETEVSDLQIQISQESAPSMRGSAWLRVPMTYRPEAIDGRVQLEAAFTDELAQKMPTAPLSSLNADSELIAGMERDLQHVTVTGLLSDGVLYISPCHTRFGNYPYCDEMRHGVFSVTKSAGAALSLLWLAQKYGAEVLDLKIVDYVDVTASHDGWSAVTFRDVIDMATGIGDAARRQNSGPYDFTADELRYRSELANMDTARGKLDVAFLAGNYEWGPGEVARYNTTHTFVLAAAMDAYLKSIEGPDANLWDMVIQEVLTPIGVHHAPLMHTLEEDGGHGVPIIGYGFFPTIGDLAKIAQLYQDRGAFDGQQLLYADEIDILLGDDPDHGLPIRWFNEFGEWSYDFSFWYMPYVSGGGCHVRIPEMEGHGGNLVTLMPNGMTGIRLADADDEAPNIFNPENMVALADSLRSFCP